MPRARAEPRASPASESQRDGPHTSLSGASGTPTDSTSRDALLPILLVRRPEGEVVAEELHDEGRVLVALLVERVELGDRIVEGLLREVARLLRLALHLVQEDGEVEREAEADRVRGREAGGLVGGRLVRLLRVGRVLQLGPALSKLGEVPVVIGLIFR